jgi:hypothetical protein
MYIQMTTKCNMKCAHCCFAATRAGKHMSNEVFMAALNLAKAYGETITLGGGEPTMHPQFHRLYMSAREMSINGDFECGVHMVTNGLFRGKVMRIVRLIENDHKQGIDSKLQVELSQDRWHEPIDMEVVHTFMKYQAQKDRAGYYTPYNGPQLGTRTVKTISPVGRGKHQQFEGMRANLKNPCACEMPLVDPDGIVWTCGCKRTQLGSVFEMNVLDDYDCEKEHAEDEK